MKKKSAQLDLEKVIREMEYQEILLKRKYYKDLNIHQKINLRSNSFIGEIWYLSRSKFHFLTGEDRGNAECLKKRYYDHYYLNHTVSYSTLSYIKKVNSKLF